MSFNIVEANLSFIYISIEYMTQIELKLIKQIRNITKKLMSLVLSVSIHILNAAA